MYKILVIGQLPKEVGGSYTTGVCNVVFEISKCYNKNVDQTVFAINIKDEVAKSLVGHTSYKGYIGKPLNMLFRVLASPLQTFKEWLFYHNVCHLSIIRCEFYKDNFLRVINEVKPDLIHCMSWIQLAPLFYANKKFEIPILQTFHGIRSEKKQIEESEKKHFAFCNFATGLTPETIFDLGRLGFPKSKSFEIPNGTDTTKFYYCENTRLSLRNEMEVDEDTTVLLTVGSLQQRKGQLEFLKILSKIPASFNYIYVIIGTGEDQKPIERFVKENNMDNRIYIKGYVDNSELFKYYSAADVYIHSSFSEGQALTEVEAYTTDLKIAVNQQILGTIVTDTSVKNDYFVFEYSNFDYSNFTLWASRHKTSRQTRMKYDWKEIYKQYVMLYKKIIDESRNNGVV